MSTVTDFYPYAYSNTVFQYRRDLAFYFTTIIRVMVLSKMAAPMKKALKFIGTLFFLIRGQKLTDASFISTLYI